MRERKSEIWRRKRNRKRMGERGWERGERDRATEGEVKEIGRGREKEGERVR